MNATQTFAWNMILAVFWALAIGRVTVGTLLTGFVMGLFTLFITRRAVGAEAYLSKIHRTARLVAHFVRDLVVANLRLAHDILTPTHHARPAIIAIPLDVTTDGEITLLANLITLTPGTLTLDVSADRRVLYIHSMYTFDIESVRREIKEGVEKRILEVMR
ncbi:MAG TPA: Na+/H+ antiporter subunit E [Thermoanaerobaculia bacterium]|nr:Na+/H+ antiporter subunit E [Thermoanaerobaculia bacterium]